MKNKIIVLFVVSLLIFGLGSCGTQPDSEGTDLEATEFSDYDAVELVVSSGWSPPGVSISADYIVEWEERVTEATGGKITFKNYWGGALGGANEQITLLEGGTIDIGLLYGWMTEDMLPLWDFHYTIPFGPTDEFDVITRATWEVMDQFPELTEELAARNCICIIRFPNLPYFIAGAKPINSIYDLKGQKAAAVGARFAKWLDPLGASLVSAPKTERYSMLQLNTISASVDCASNMYEYDQVSVAPNVFDPQILTPASESVFFNLEKFNSLPQEFQDILLNTGREMSYEIGDTLMPRDYKRIIQQWEDADPDFKITTITPEERKEWAKACPDTAKEWKEMMDAKGFPGTEIIDAYIKACSDLGYQWPND